MTSSACTWVTVFDRSKFSLMADSTGGNLTLKKIDRNDNDNYQCTVKSSYGLENPGSNSIHVTPLPPGMLFIIMNLHEKSEGYDEAYI